LDLLLPVAYEFAKQKFAALLDRSDSAPVDHVTAAASAGPGLFTDVVTNPLGD
jgi:epoxyqueuosine reductase QueG